MLFVGPLSYGILNASSQADEAFNGGIFVTKIGEAYKDIFSVFGNMVKEGIYWKTVGCFTLFYSVFFFIGVIRSMPKHQYADIEHGSSDWAENGEQYKVLHSKEGILLAEKNYLPVDKRGNVNVLVVGRFRFW